MLDGLLAVMAAALLMAPAAPVPSRPALPIIDMHVHAGRLALSAPVPICPGDQLRDYPADMESQAVACARPTLSPTNGAALRDQTIAALRRHNVRRAVLSGRAELVAEWSAVAPGLFLPASVPALAKKTELERLERLRREGRIAVLAELGAQYDGIRADDPSLAPFWAMAEKLDLPVGIHLGEGMPGQSADGRGTRYRAGLTSPFQLEEVLIKHPRLRLWVMHAASPLTDEMIAMLFEYPQLYVDVGANVWNMPRAQFYDQLRRMVEAGFSRRIMFGSDQTIWPQAIGLAIESIERAPFLDARQKRDILYNNAARFLRLTPEQIAADHR